jgi:hypothetical protein
MVVRNKLGFREVVKPVDSFGIPILHDENKTGIALVSGFQEEVIRAEVKHDINLTGGASY